MSNSVQTGLDVLIHERIDLIRGRRVGLVTHPAAVRADLTTNIDALQLASVQLAALFGPEHGLYGAAEDGAAVADGVDGRTGLPIFSLYGATKIPTPEMLEDVDVLVFDMQDVGARFYTFISTLFYILQGAAQAGKPVLVLDRPNPINGQVLEGPLTTPKYTSFVGIVPVPIRHGLTVGEMALYMNQEHRLGVELNVVKMRGWQRVMWFDQTGLPWVPTSPAMPHLSTATVYPGMCLLEGTNLSDGRGTALPFEVCGAAWLGAHALAQHLNTLALPGVRFRPTRFKPTAGRFKNTVCRGVQIHVRQRNIFRPVLTGLHVLTAVRELYPERFKWREACEENTYRNARDRLHIDLLSGTDAVRLALDRGDSAPSIVAGWETELRQFTQVAQNYYLYT